MKSTSFVSSTEKRNRPLAKLAYVQGFEGDASPRTATYSSVREDSSTASLSKLPAEVELCKRSNNLLTVRNLSKYYGSNKVVDQISFDIYKGECFGLLGPNGAGKTTTIEMIEQITPADSGEILFKQNRPDTDFPEYLGVQFQETALLPYLTVVECLETFRNLYNHSLSLDEIMDLCQIKDFKDQQHNKISGGQRQRLLLAIALCNDPELLLLDEPTTGLDPQARRHLWEVIKKIKKNGKSIILTTHYMEEAGELCDQIAIMDRGKIIASGNPQELLEKNFNTVSISLSGLNPNMDGFDSLFTKEEIFFRSGMAFINTNDISQVLKKMIDSGISLQGLRIRESNLEDLFLKLTGETIRT
ncbi:ATP-binding cassette domain-containing protein [Candidatus Tisiphia endosymbiont of Sialis lutaria]|uniref:ATP-binding cassette domain-containing protein n=1 Tax=Candidatus Tisiphia endosymbiont of Sialis lutaria TaxID=2029164 RepID=UPI00312CA60F